MAKLKVIFAETLCAENLKEDRYMSEGHKTHLIEGIWGTFIFDAEQYKV